jgi:hypothetical protein
MPPRTNFPFCLRLVAVLLCGYLTLGSPWDSVQLFAWAKQFAVASRAMPLLSAVRVTFAPGNLCSIEVATRDQDRARSSSDPIEAAATARKVPLASFAVASRFTAPVASPDRPSFGRAADFVSPAAFVSDVPVPPPRATA